MRNAAAQRHRVNRAMNFARANVSEPLDLEALADVACLSKYHFARVFDAHFNEMPSQFLARIRTELAARKLVYLPDNSITQIALDCGYSGSDVFSRSFRMRFGISPRLFKSSNQWNFSALDAAHPFSEQIYQPNGEFVPPDIASLDLRIEQRPACHVAYIRHVGPYGDVRDSITKTFDTLQNWARLRGLIQDDTSYAGLVYDACSTTPAQHCVYDACMILHDEVAEDDIVSVQTLPAGQCAVLNTVCQPNQLHKAWIWLTSTWLPGSGRKLSFQPRYEYFAQFGDRRVVAGHGVQLCLPIDR